MSTTYEHTASLAVRAARVSRLVDVGRPGGTRQCTRDAGCVDRDAESSSQPGQDRENLQGAQCGGSKAPIKALSHSHSFAVELQMKDVIGLGSQATVKEGLVKKTKEKVAIKVYEVRCDNVAFACGLALSVTSVLPSAQRGHREFSEEEVLREAYLMKKCEHEGILKFLNIYETKKTFELVVEFANVGEWLNTVGFTARPAGNVQLYRIQFVRADSSALLCR